MAENLPTTEKVHEPDPDWQRRKEELASGRHAEKPCGAHEGKQLQCRSWRGDPERKERQAKEHGVLQVGKSPMVLLQVSQAIPKVEGRLQARDVLAAMRRVGLCPGAPASVAGGKTVEERQVDVLREERRQLGLSRSKIHRICFFLFAICPKKKNRCSSRRIKRKTRRRRNAKRLSRFFVAKKATVVETKKESMLGRLEPGRV